MKEQSWQYRDLSVSLLISISEIAESLNRSQLAGLIDESRRKVFRQSLMEFIQFGLHYVFPQVPGSLVTGVPTAHSHPFFKSRFSGEVDFVWPLDGGTTRGLAVEPLYKAAAKAVIPDECLYKLLASIDIIRVGKTREIKLALEVLRKMIL